MRVSLLPGHTEEPSTTFSFNIAGSHLTELPPSHTA